MQRPPQITFKDIGHSDAIEARIHERIAKLEEISVDIVGCQVRVRAPHRRQHKGKQYVIDLDVQMPASTLHLDRRPGDDEAHTDITIAIRDTFEAMERKLRKWKDKHKGRPAILESPLQGRIDSIDHDKNHGQIATTDGRLIYFHAHSVIDAKFEDLAKGDTVELSVDQKDADEGPHASMVRPVGSLRFVDTV